MTLKKVNNALEYLIKADENFPESSEWSVKEKLALASAVIETGQEYWPSISRLIQSFGSSRRKEDKSWCSSKECAKQYSKLIDNIEKKKRSDINNSSLPLKELIVKKLTVDRIEELQEDIRKEQEKQSVLKELLNDLESGKLDDSVTEIWSQLKENSDFVRFVCGLNKRNAEGKVSEKEPESETTDAMTSSCIDEDSNSENDEKPRLLLHLKKTIKRPNDNEEENDFESKSSKIESDKESCDSCDTEPAVYVMNISANYSSPHLKVEDIQREFNSVVGESKNFTEYESSSSSNCAWIKRSKNIIGNVIDDPNCHLFDSVALSKKDPNYKKIVKRIINLVDIRNKLRDNLYSSPQEFEHDLLLVICNAVMYYPLGSPSNKIVKNIYDKIHPLLECLHEGSDSGNFSSVEPVSRRTRKCITHN